MAIVLACGGAGLLHVAGQPAQAHAAGPELRTCCAQGPIASLPSLHCDSITSVPRLLHRLVA